MPISQAPAVPSLVFPVASGEWRDVRALVAGGTSAAALVALDLYLSPIVLTEATPLDRIGTNVTTGAAAGKLARYGIYVPTGRYTYALAVDGGTAVVDAIADSIVTISYTAPAGRLLVAMVSDGTPTIQVTQTSNSVIFGTALPAAVNFRGVPHKGIASTTLPLTVDLSSGFSYVTNTFHRIAVRAL